MDEREFTIRANTYMEITDLEQKEEFEEVFQALDSRGNVPMSYDELM